MTDETKDLFHKILRHVIDTDGSLTPSSYLPIFNSQVSDETFDDYDAKENKMSPSVYSSIFKYAKDRYTENNVPATERMLREDLNSNVTLSGKHDFAEILTKIRRTGDANPNDVPHLLSKLFDTYRKNGATWEIQRYLKNVDTVGSAAALSKMQEGLTDLASLSKVTRVQAKVQDAGEMADEFLTKLEKGESAVKYVAKWGFPELDRMTNGLGEGECAYISADTNTGKSSLGAEIAIFNCVDMGKKVVMASNEQTKYETAARIIARQTSIPVNVIKAGKSQMTDEQFEQVRQCWLAIREMKDRLLFLPQGSFENVKQMKSLLHQKWGVDHGVDLFFMDYPDNLQPSSRMGGAQWEKNGVVIDEVFNFAAEENFALLAPTQNSLSNGDQGKAKDRDRTLTSSRFKTIAMRFNLGYQLSIDPYDPPVYPNEVYGRGTPGTLILKCVRNRGGAKDWQVRLRAEFSTSSWSEAEDQGMRDVPNSRLTRNHHDDDHDGHEGHGEDD